MKNPQEYWEHKANDLKAKGKFEEAVKIFDKIKGVKEEEKDKNFWYKKAIQLLEIGEVEQAKNYLEKNLNVNKKNFDSFYLMGQILYRFQNYEDSLEYYNRAFEEYSSTFLRNSSKVEHMKEARKFEEAVKYADKIYQQKDIDNNFWHHKGLSLLKLKKYKQASSCFEAFLKKDSKNISVLSLLAKSEFLAGNKQNVKKLLEKITQIDSKFKIDLRKDDLESISESHFS